MTHQSNSISANQLLTKEDLAEFRKHVIADIKELLNENSEKPAWIKSGEVRQLLKISKSTLQLLRMNGTLSFSKIGNMYYYSYEDICKLLKK